MPPPPYKFNVTDKNSDYYKEVKLSQQVVDSLTPEQTFIADFWDDNPFKLNVSGHLMFGTKKFSPAGHWMSVVGIAAQKAGVDFPATVAAYAKTSIALFDAFIQCWNIKYIYNTIRPETVIDKYFDANWRPHLQTPPFPEYTCGHCTISAAASEALTSVFGDNFSYSDTTELEFGIGKRSFTSFRNAALETKDMARALSRLTGSKSRPMSRRNWPSSPTVKSGVSELSSTPSKAMNIFLSNSPVVPLNFTATRTIRGSEMPLALA